MKAIITLQPPPSPRAPFFSDKAALSDCSGGDRVLVCMCVCIHTFACVCAAKWDIPNAIHWIQEAHHLKDSVKR